MGDGYRRNALEALCEDGGSDRAQVYAILHIADQLQELIDLIHALKNSQDGGE